MSEQNSGIMGRIASSLGRNRLGELLVMKGFISRYDLRSALKTQKATNTPLGQVFLESAIISRWQLAKILGRQALLRGCLTALLFGTSLIQTSGQHASADMSRYKPAPGVIMASATQEFSRVSRYPTLLGTTEKRNSDLKAFTKWTGMFKRFDREVSRSANQEILSDWQSDINKFQGQSMKQMAKSVNRHVNQSRYILDKNNWGKSDYWATPVEFLKRGGDCEDFAIAKYAALRSLGFPEERLRVAIVQDTKKGIAHAVLVAYTDEGAYILDNQIKTLVDAESKGRYKPIFSINRQSWWLHTAPKTTIVASAR